MQKLINKAAIVTFVAVFAADALALAWDVLTGLNPETSVSHWLAASSVASAVAVAAQVIAACALSIHLMTVRNDRMAR